MCFSVHITTVAYGLQQPGILGLVGGTISGELPNLNAGNCNLVCNSHTGIRFQLTSITELLLQPLYPNFYALGFGSKALV